MDITIPCQLVRDLFTGEASVGPGPTNATFGQDALDRIIFCHLSLILGFYQ